MVTLETVSTPVSDIPTSGSQRPYGGKWMGWAYESLVSPDTEAGGQPSAMRTLGIGRSTSEAYGRMAHLVRLRRSVDAYLGVETQDWSPTGAYLDTQREALKQEVYELLIDAGKENWDGEGSLALQQDTVAVAQELIDRFPPYIGAPDVAATPHGEVDFDWVISREVMLTVSMGPSKEIAFAALFQGTRLNGSEPWNGVLPHFVQCCFERLREAQSA